MYAVVLFKIEQSVEVVPMSWISNTAKDMCVWPPLKGTGLTRAVQKRAPPEATWQTYEVEVLRETDHYDKARSKCKKAIEGLSDLATKDDNAKRKSLKPKQLYDSSDEPSQNHSKDSDVEPLKKKLKKRTAVLPNPPTVPTFGPNLSLNETTGSSMQLIIAQPVASTSAQSSLDKSPANNSMGKAMSLVTGHGPGQFAILGKSFSSKSSTSQRTLVMNSPPSCSSRKSMSPVNDTDGDLEIVGIPTERDLKLFTMVEMLTRLVRQNGILIKSLINKQQLPAVPDEGCDVFKLPLQTEADMENLESILVSRPQQRVLTAYLNSLGGITGRDVVDRIMQAIFTHPLACQYNWAGRGKKMGINTFHLTKVIKDAAKNSNVKEAEAEMHLRNWLRYASDRSGGRKIRHDKNKKTLEERQRFLAAAMESSEDEED